MSSFQQTPKFDIHGRFVITQKTYKKYSCAICKKVPNTLLQTRCHHKICRTCFNSKMIKDDRSCPFCLQKFQRTRNVEMVLDSDHKTLLKVKAFVCYICQYETYDGVKSFNEQHICSENVQIICPWKTSCIHKSFTSTHALAQHIMFDHFEPNVRRVKCPFCAERHKLLPPHIYQNHDDLDLLVRM